MAMSVSPGGGDRLACEVNTTPLIDVMLVLLVMMIMTLPAQNHLIKMAGAGAATPTRPPPTIYIDIDPDGTVVWNSEPLAGFEALEAHFREESGKRPQAQIHLEPSAVAKYDVVAQVMASAQRNGMTQMDFTNIARFSR